METHCHMAPELFEGAGYSQKADMFSVGVIMFELEHKRRPTKEEYEAVQKGHNVSKHERLGDLMCRLLQTDTEKRPTASEAISMI